MSYGSRMADDGGTSLRRGLRTLEVLAGADGDGDRGLGVVDVARRLGVDKSQASRTLRALAEHGLAERDAVTRGYRIGPRVFAYAALVSERRLLRAAPPVLDALVQALGERAHLSVLDGSAVLTLLSHSPPHAVQAAGWAGRTVPAYCTAAGRALLADHDPAALRARFEGVELVPRGPNAVESLEDLGTRVHEAARARLRVRRRGARAGTVRRRGSRAPLRRSDRRSAERVRPVVPLRRAAPGGRRGGGASGSGPLLPAARGRRCE